MAEINNAIALGIQAPPVAKPADIIAPISSLAQLSYLNANADKVKAETSGLEQTAAFSRAKNQSLQYLATLRSQGVPLGEAVSRSGAAIYDPTGTTALLGNEGTARTLEAHAAYAKANPNEPLGPAGPEAVGKDVTNKSTLAATEKTKVETAKAARELAAIQNYKPGDPNSLSAGGPAMVGIERTNLETEAKTAKANVEVTQAHRQLYGAVGNVMTSPGGASPEGRAIVADLARKAGAPESEIQKYMTLPDDKYREAGQHFQIASIYPEKYAEVSGQAEYNKGLAKVATSQEKVGSDEVVSRGPAAYAVAHGLPVPPNPASAPSSGVVGQPSLGNFAPPAAQPGAPSLANPAAAPSATAPAAPAGPSLGGASPAVPSLTPTSPAAAPVTPPGTPTGPAIRAVNAVPTPSVGVNVPAAVTDAGKRYGVSPEFMARTFQIESGGNPQAYNAQSKAAGPFQFVPSTGAKYLNGASPFDVAGSADAAARLAKDNSFALTGALGRVPTDAELYLAHQQGATGAIKLLTNPNARAGDLVGNSAIAANGGNPNAPAASFTNLWTTKFNGGAGRSIPAQAVAPAVTPTAPAPGGAGAVIPGAIEPLSAALTPAPARVAAPVAPAAAPAAPAVAPAPIPTATPATPAVPVAPTPAVQPVRSAAPPATGLAADKTKPLLPQGYQPVDAGPSKAVLAEQKTQGEQYGKVGEDLDKSATAAKATNATLDQMAQSSDTWRMGKWSETQQKYWREPLQAIAQTLGINAPALDRQITDYQDFAKLSGNILRQASHDTSSRVGIQEMSLISKSLPNPEMSEGGFKQIATQLKGVNDFAIAKQQAAAAWKAKNNGSLSADKSGKDFQATWNADASPAAFILHRMQQENPQALQNLIATMSKTPEGITALKNMKSQMQWANDQGLFGK